MSANNHDYQSIKSPAGRGAKNGDQIKSLQNSGRTKKDLSLKGFHKTNEKIEKFEIPSETISEKKTVSDGISVSAQNNTTSKEDSTLTATPKQKGKQKKQKKTANF